VLAAEQIERLIGWTRREMDIANRTL
jgi:hypothetical protein